MQGDFSGVELFTLIAFAWGYIVVFMILEARAEEGANVYFDPYNPYIALYIEQFPFLFPFSFPLILRYWGISRGELHDSLPCDLADSPVLNIIVFISSLMKFCSNL